MRIISYREEFEQQVIDLILHIQNEEAKINLPLQQQPDLLDIRDSYISRGGEFLVAIENGVVIGTAAANFFKFFIIDPPVYVKRY